MLRMSHKGIQYNVSSIGFTLAGAELPSSARTTTVRRARVALLPTLHACNNAHKYVGEHQQRGAVSDQSVSARFWTGREKTFVASLTVGSDGKAVAIPGAVLPSGSCKLTCLQLSAWPALNTIWSLRSSMISNRLVSLLGATDPAINTVYLVMLQD